MSRLSLRPLAVLAAAFVVVASPAFAAESRPDRGPATAAESAPASAPAPPKETVLPGLTLVLDATLETDPVGAPPDALVAFAFPEIGRVDVWRVERTPPEPSVEFVASWLDAKRPGDTLAGGIVSKGGVMRAHTKGGKGLVVAATAHGAYVVVVSPGRLLDDAVRDARVTAPPPRPPARAATKTGLTVRVPPGFVIATPGEAPSWAEVALSLPSLGAFPPALWLHTARPVAAPLDQPAGREAALAVLREELGHAGLPEGAAAAGAEAPPRPATAVVVATAAGTAAGPAAPGRTGAGRLETITMRTFVTIRAETLNWDLLAAYGMPGADGLVAVLRVPKGGLSRYESALRGVLGSIALPGPDGAPAAGPGETVATAAPGAGGAHADGAAGGGGPAPMSAQRALVALVLFLGLSTAALVAWRRIKRAGVGGGKAPPTETRR